MDPRRDGTDPPAAGELPVSRNARIAGSTALSADNVVITDLKSLLMRWSRSRDQPALIFPVSSIKIVDLRHSNV